MPGAAEHQNPEAGGLIMSKVANRSIQTAPVGRELFYRNGKQLLGRQTLRERGG